LQFQIIGVMLRQTLEQKLLQKLSPQQIQLMKLLQIPTVALEQRIKQEIEENPALESGDNELDDNEERDDELLNEENNAIDDDEITIDDEFDINDYIDDDIPDYKLYSNNNTEDDQKTIPYASGTTFRDYLLEQLSLKEITQKQFLIGEQIVGNLDDAGYLQRNPQSIADDLMFLQNISAEASEILDVLEIIQQLDPPGVGARNLKECLLIQLKKKPTNASVDRATAILSKMFDEFSKKHYDKILKKININEDELKEVIDVILTLNPKPGGSTSETERANVYVVPDFFIHNDNGILELNVNSRNVPELKVNRSYIEMLSDLSKTQEKINEQQKQTIQFVKQKVDSAKWFIDAIKQRQNTLYVTMKAIMDYQKDYFLSGDETTIKPMILKDIAEIVQLDISTVSRVANSKYVQTPFGTFLLKTFFSESLTNDAGEEVSSREVKRILEDTIENEDKRKPVTDEELTKILKTKGYNIARRTVAKYREVLGIPVARLRKTL
jgi:RNA polymerase sigma-54 factor